MNKLPLRFLLLLAVNLAVLIGLGSLLGLHNRSIRDLEVFYLVLGGSLAALEEWLWDKLQGRG